MYLPSHFAEDDQAKMVAFMAAHSFATLVSVIEGAPFATHLPLIVGTDGRRLAKRHGDTRLSHYRGVGVPVGRVRALLARWCGIECDADVSMNTILEQFTMARLPREQITMTAEDDAWLRAL